VFNRVMERSCRGFGCDGFSIAFASSPCHLIAPVNAIAPACHLAIGLDHDSSQKPFLPLKL
jgi:hypothetical protein